MNNILSCDTSTGTLHLALRSGGRMYERMLESFSHSEGLLSQILSFLEEAGIGIGALGLPFNIMIFPICPIFVLLFHSPKFR